MSTGSSSGSSSDSDGKAFFVSKGFPGVEFYGVYKGPDPHWECTQEVKYHALVSVDDPAIIKNTDLLKMIKKIVAAIGKKNILNDQSLVNVCLRSYGTCRSTTYITPGAIPAWYSKFIGNLGLVLNDCGVGMFSINFM